MIGVDKAWAELHAAQADLERALEDTVRIRGTPRADRVINEAVARRRAAATALGDARCAADETTSP